MHFFCSFILVFLFWVLFQILVCSWLFFVLHSFWTCGAALDSFTVLFDVSFWYSNGLHFSIILLKPLRYIWIIFGKQFLASCVIYIFAFQIPFTCVCTHLFFNLSTAKLHFMWNEGIERMGFWNELAYEVQFLDFHSFSYHYSSLRSIIFSPSLDNLVCTRLAIL